MIKMNDNVYKELLHAYVIKMINFILAANELPLNVHLACLVALHLRTGSSSRP